MGSVADPRVELGVQVLKAHQEEQIAFSSWSVEKCLEIREVVEVGQSLQDNAELFLSYVSH